MNRRHRHQDDFSDALANFSLTFAKAMLVFCVVLMALISPSITKTEGIKPKVEFLLTVDWPPGDNDVDVWMRDPDGKIMYYGNKEAGVLNLERDDLGYTNNVMFVDGKKIINQTHQEMVSIRGFYPGEYVVNVQLFRSGGLHGDGDAVTPIPVTVTLTKMNPTVTQVWSGKVELHAVKEEVHVMRFTMSADGTVSNFTTDLPVSLIEKVTRGTAQ